MVIDQVAYPHIVDRIFFNAPLSVVLAFRATSHYFRRKVDSSAHHMVIFGNALWSEDGCLEVPLELVPSCSLLQYTRVLDIHSSKEAEDFAEPLLDTDHTFDVVRIYEDTVCKIPAGRLVICMARTVLTDLMGYDTLLFYQSIPVHMDVDNCDWYCSHRDPFADDFVFICAGCPSIQEVVSEVADKVRCLSYVGSITIVGLVPELQARKSLQAARKRIQKVFLDLLRAEEWDQQQFGALFHRSPCSDEWVDWNFLTRQEYIATLQGLERSATFPGEAPFTVRDTTGWKPPGVI